MGLLRHRLIGGSSARYILVRVLGKISGAGIGYYFAGPFGALAGVALGHQLFDRPPRAFFGVPMSEREIKNSVFFVAAFSMLAKLAEADGRVTDEETDAIKFLVKNRFHLSHRSADFAFKTFSEAIDNDESFENHAAAFYTQFAQSPEALSSMLEIMLIVAHADFEYDASEETLIKQAASIFGLADQYGSILALYVNDPDNLGHCYQLLGSSPDDSPDDINERYVQLLSEHNPDKLLAEGVPRELIPVAEEQYTKIQNAHQHIISSREPGRASTS